MNMFLPPALGEDMGAPLVGLPPGEAEAEPETESAACWALRTAASSLWKLVQ